MAKGADSKPRKAKRARLPQFRDARPRQTEGQRFTTDTSSIITFNRSSAGKLQAQERERQRQTSQQTPPPSEEPTLPQVEEPPPPPEANDSLTAVSTEAPRKGKRKRVYTNKVSSFRQRLKSLFI